MSSTQATENPIENELFLALQKLASFALPNLKEILLFALVLLGLTSIKQNLAVDHVGLFLIFYALYPGWSSRLKLHRDQGSHNEGGNSTPVESRELGPTFKTVWDKTGDYFKFALTFALACYVLVHYDVHLYLQLWLYSLIIAAVTIVGFFAPTTKFAGPLMFGWIKYSQGFAFIHESLRIWLLCSWILLSFAPLIFPFFALGTLSVFLVASLTVYLEYHRELRDISNETAELMSRTSIAIAAAKEYAAVGNEYQKQIVDITISARRDAFLAESVKMTDFFDQTVDAWGALSRVNDYVDKLETKAQVVFNTAGEVVDEQGGDEPGPANQASDEFGSAAAVVVDEARNVKAQLEGALARVSESKVATAHDQKARELAKSNAVVATKAARDLVNDLSNNIPAGFTASESADKTQRLANQALVLATEGDMANARARVLDAKTATDVVVAQKKELEKAMIASRVVLLDFLNVVTVTTG